MTSIAVSCIGHQTQTNLIYNNTEGLTCPSSFAR